MICNSEKNKYRINQKVYGKIVLVFCVLVFCPLHAIDFELNLAGDIGKRFADRFDARWKDLRTDYAETSQTATITELISLRNIYGGYASLMISPFFKHYMGIAFIYQGSLEKGSLNQTISNSSASSSVSFLQYAPALSYKYYFDGAKKDLYLGADVGFSMGTLTIDRTISGIHTKYTLDRARGLLVRAKLGYAWNIFWRAQFFLEGGADLVRLDSLEGTSGSEPVTLKYNNSYMVAVKDSESSQFKDYDTAIFYSARIFFSLGFNLRF